jgi:hypothetical protein
VPQNRGAELAQHAAGVGVAGNLESKQEIVIGHVAAILQ